MAADQVVGIGCSYEGVSERGGCSNTEDDCQRRGNTC
jgi:hypothetical protein